MSSSRGRRHTLADGGRELRVAVDLPQPDLPRRHQAEEEADRGLLGRQGARGLDPPSKLLVQALDGVRRPQRLPLRPGEAKEGEQLLAALREAPRDPRTALAPFALEVSVRDARPLPTGGIDDAMEVLAELAERMLGGLPLQVPQLVHGAALHRGLGPRAPDRLPQARVAVDNPHQRPPPPPPRHPPDQPAPPGCPFAP